MRFAILVKGSAESETGCLPSTELLTEMGRYNEELVRAGILLAGEGLHPSSAGFRVQFDGSRRDVVAGPFGEPEKLVSGFWLLQVKSQDEAVEWARRIPFVDGEVEIRRVFEAEDFGEEFTPELRAQEDRIRERLAAVA